MLFCFLLIKSTDKITISESTKHEKKNLLRTSITFMSTFVNENALSLNNSYGKVHFRAENNTGNIKILQILSLAISTLADISTY
jgi:hypothetical protein